MKMIKICSESDTVTADDRRTEDSIDIKQTDEHCIISMNNDDTEQKIIK